MLRCNGEKRKNPRNGNTDEDKESKEETRNIKIIHHNMAGTCSYNDCRLKVATKEYLTSKWRKEKLS